jgi:fucose 4-O-acetylase-like acetyltransferase
MLAVAYLWVHTGLESERWSLFRQLGTTSLLVYWVHIEIVYGRWFGIWKEDLSVAQVVAFTIALLALMTVLSILRTKYTSLSGLFKPAPAPRRASGD